MYIRHTANCFRRVSGRLLTVCGFMPIYPNPAMAVHSTPYHTILHAGFVHSVGLFASLMLALFFIAFILLIYFLRKKTPAINAADKNSNAFQLENENSMLQQQLLSQERIASLEKTLHERECDLRSKDLITEALQTVSRIKTLKRVEHLVANAKQDTNPATIRETIRPLYRNDEAWEQFKIRFDLAYPFFFSGFRKSFPALSEQDLRLAAYTRANLHHNDIAQLCFISPSSLQKRLFRLRKKLGIRSNTELRSLINRF